MDVIVFIDGRKAIPIRALPYITGWTMSPDVVAKKLARDEHWTAMPMDMNAYYKENEGYRPMAPKEWDGIVADLKECANESIENDRSYASWRRESTSLLPANCFVWKIDFEKSYKLAYSPKAITIVNEREGERDLKFSPLIPKELLTVVMEGFKTATEPNKVTDQSHNEMPWLIHNPDDPEPTCTWYTQARYFARELIKETPTLLNNRSNLAKKVNEIFKKYGIKKRGGKKDFDSDTIRKAFVNVTFR